MLIVLPFVLIEMPLTPTSDEVAGALMLMVALLPLDDWLRLMGPVPTKMTFPVVTVPLVPAVLPIELIPAPIPPPPPAFTEAVITDPAPRPKLTPLELEKMTDASPEEFAPAEKVTFPAPAFGAEITTEPFEMPTEAAPAPWNTSPARFRVPELP